MAQNSNRITLNNQYMPRPRINNIFARATLCKLVYVIANAGYGKTQAVRRYVEQQDAVVRWVQLNESDNIAVQYWENFTYIVSLDNPELARNLRELGFPETPAQFNQFALIQKNTEIRSPKTFLVFDDFHLIHSNQALSFTECCANLQIPGMCVIIISRKEPEINALNLLANGDLSIITEDELRFTDDEILEFLKRYKISFSARNLPRFSEATKGWALALQLFLLIIKRMPNDFDSALSALKQNVFKLFETEAFNGFSEDIKKKILQLSIISDLPKTLWHESLNDTPYLSSFIWFDSFSDNYRIHPLYLEFLQSKQDILSHEEKQYICSKAAQWCLENKIYMKAMYYFAQIRYFDRMLEILLSYPFKLPHHTCEYFFNILEDLDRENQACDDYNFLLLKILFIPLLLSGMDKYEEAKKRTLNNIQEWENSDKPFAPYLLCTAYNNLTYIEFHDCVVTHNYDYSKYLKKALEYFKSSSVTPVKITGAFSFVDIRSFACPVGENAELEEFDRFIETAREIAGYIEETHHKMYSGYEYLSACEVAFYKNQPESVKIYANQAIMKARGNKQYGIEMTAIQYLLRISMYEGDYRLTKNLLDKLREHLDNADFWNCRLLYDLYTGFFYAQLELKDMIPLWIVMDEGDIATEFHMPVRELLVGVKSHMAMKKYNHALILLSNSSPREPYNRLLFGELLISLFAAVAKIKTGDIPGAVEDFNKAYSLSFKGVFEMPFIELGKNLSPLIIAASNHKNCNIPHNWLTKINYKASAYAKKINIIADNYKNELKIEDTVELSAREYEVLIDLYHGLSREEIAAHRFLSVNTVKKILQSIYIKLDASNNIDAIRIALKKKLIE